MNREIDRFLINCKLLEPHCCSIFCRPDINFFYGKSLKFQQKQKGNQVHNRNNTRKFLSQGFLGKYRLFILTRIYMNVGHFRSSTCKYFKCCQCLNAYQYCIFLADWNKVPRNLPRVGQPIEPKQQTMSQFPSQLSCSLHSFS